MREDPPLKVTVATVVAERQASAGARDGVKGKRNDLAARAPLHALVRRPEIVTREAPAYPARVPFGTGLSGIASTGVRPSS